MRALNRLFSRFFRDRRGNISMIFGLTVVPLVVAVGTGVDYSLAARMKAKLQSAADAAAVGSISDNSPGYLAATQMTSDGPVARPDRRQQCFQRHHGHRLGLYRPFGKLDGH